MNKLWSTAFLVMGINIILLLLSFIAPGLGIVFGMLVLIAELITGLALTSNKESRQKGQGILLGLGLFILIGGSVCGIILMNLSIGH